MPTSLMNIDNKINECKYKIFKQIKAKQYTNRIIYYDQGVFISRVTGMVQCTQIHVIHHINKRRDKNHMIVSIDAEKTFAKSNIHS